MDREKIKKKFLQAQQSEITEHFIYRNLSRSVKNLHNRKVLQKISNDEKKHYKYLKRVTKDKVFPRKWEIFFYLVIVKFFGLTFGIKLMEKGEDLAQKVYAQLKERDPHIESILHDEEEHEKELLRLMDEERLRYVSSIVLGINDALVELTGALAGLTLALQNSRLIAVVGFITGIAAALSMGASEYLSTKQEKTDKSAFKASIYTGTAYLVTVLLLIFPYFIFSNALVCLGFVLFNALLIILIFTFYISVAKELSFKKRFLEMAGLSLSIALFSFIIGFFVRKFFGVDV